MQVIEKKTFGIKFTKEEFSVLEKTRVILSDLFFGTNEEYFRDLFCDGDNHTKIYTFDDIAEILSTLVETAGVEGVEDKE